MRNIDNIYNYSVTSPQDVNYNCISWTFEDRSRLWWPSSYYFWPPNVPREVTVQAFIQLYVTYGYSICQNAELESDYDKVAIYARDTTPTHVARQLHNGRWTSKLLDEEDVEHSDLEDLLILFGNIAAILKKPRAA